MAASSSSSLTSPYLFLVITLLSFSLLSISLLFYSLLKRLNKTEQFHHQEDEKDPQCQTSITSLKLSLSKISNKTQNAHQLNPTTHLSRSFLLESNSPKWGPLFSGIETDEIEKKKKKKKKRKKKKEMMLENSGGGEDEVGALGLAKKKKEEELVCCLYPFTSSSSATQRKIKQHYDQLVMSHQSEGLTLSQVGQFVNCLVDARNELQQKSEYIKRKFTITKALLLKADRSSFDRLRQQMVEVGACMELKAKSDESTKSLDTEQNIISFEEFLAKEKKDTFWKKYAKAKSC